MKLGFCCKYIDDESQVKGIKSIDACKQYNTSTTTISWLNKQETHVSEQKLWDLMVHNINSTQNLVSKVNSFVPELRMLRISSDLLPAYTHEKWSYFYKKPDVISFLEKNFAIIGESARNHGTRLSFHPGQFCCIVSDKENVVDNSLAELEYHADMARMMGYGLSKLDFKINVHLSGKGGIDLFDLVYRRMSVELRNCLTLENDEYQSSLDLLIKLKNHVGIVLDIHHHFIKDHEYISNTDSRINHIIDSWCGVRPVIHYSQSKDSVIGQYNNMPQMSDLLSHTSKGKLRAHCDFYHNSAINDWALSHLSWADIQCEAKGKNIATSQLYEYFLKEKSDPLLHY